MDPTGKPVGRAPGVSGPPRAELVLLKGRHAGTHRVLEGDLVLFGRAQGCDFRLTADGIAARHCLLARTPAGWQVRDLGSATGTFVDGNRVAAASLTDGARLAIGPVEFQVHLPAVPAPEGSDAAGALRIQAAAVAAQQAALDEEEARLEQRRAALQHQETQLASLLEERRRELESLREQAQAAAAGTAAVPENLEAAGAAILAAQRASLEDQAKIERERQRLVRLNKRLRRRWHRFWLAERRRLEKERQVLQEETALLHQDHGNLETREHRFQEARLRFAAFYEIARRRLRDSWRNLRDQRRRWKHRRGCERAALKVRAFDLEQAERRLVRAQELFLREKKTWDEAKHLLVEELRGLRRRRDNLHHRLHLEQDGREPLPLLEPEIVDDSPAGAGETEPIQVAPEDAGPGPKPTPTPGALVVRADVSPRDLPDSADRPLLLAEAWHRLAIVQQRWQERRRDEILELQAVAHRLEEEAQALARRAQEQQALERVLQDRHEEMLRLRRHMIAWRARLRVQEQTWNGERERLLELTRRRLAQGEKHQSLLNDMRLRWNRRRRQEMEDLRKKKENLLAEARALMTLRDKLQKSQAALEDEKRHFNERTLALEQLRQEVLRQTDPVTAKRRLERFRRRWITQQADALRKLQNERTALAGDFAALRHLADDIERQDEDTVARRIELAEKWAAWEHQELLAGTRQSRLEAELHQAEIQVRLTRQQLDKARDEVERIARALLAEPDPPQDALASAA